MGDEATRAALLAAFARAGIAYPEDRLDEAVAEFADLSRRMALIRDAVPSDTEPAPVFALAASRPGRDG